MKDYPIIFCTDMVKATLEDKKTQTRRTAGLEKVNIHPDDWDLRHTNNTKTHFLAFFVNKRTGEKVVCKCPYGRAGSRLWVRETFAKRADGVGQILFKADYESIIKMFNSTERPDWLPPLPPWPQIKWKPSIHMFRKDARLFPELTKVRAGRLQEITEKDAIAEGAEYMAAASPREERLSAAVIVFAGLWDTLNAKRGYGWDFNPWVWPLDFNKGKILATGAEA